MQPLRDLVVQLRQRTLASAVPSGIRWDRDWCICNQCLRQLVQHQVVPRAARPVVAVARLLADEVVQPRVRSRRV